MSAGRVRAFLALEIPDELRARLASLARDLAPHLPGIRLARPEGIHLTLRFLGSSSREQLESVCESAGQAAAECPRGEAQVAGLGLFPPRGAPRVLWIGVNLEGPVLALQRACEAAAVAAGFGKEDRPFHPHLTLGRWKDRARRPVLRPESLGLLRLDELVLFRSEPQDRGSAYTALRRFTLGSPVLRPTRL